MASQSSQQDNKKTSIDQILNYLGDIGRYQSQVFFLSVLPVFIAGMLSTSFVFTTAIPEHRCFINNCDNQLQLHSFDDVIMDTQFNKTFLEFTTPKLTTSTSEKYDGCHIYQLNNLNANNCTKDYFDSTKLQECDSYIVNSVYFESTIVTDFKLFCDKEWIVQMLQTIFFFGVLVGSLVNGVVGDKFGRKTIFKIFSPLVVISIMISLVSPNPFLYAISLLIKGLCVAGIYQSGFTVGVECLGGKWRFWLGNLYSIIFATGGIYASIMAWLFRSWKEIEATNMIPSIFMLAYPFIMCESIRWQFSSGHTDDAIEQLSIAARKNGTHIPEKIIESYLATKRSTNNLSDPSNVSMKDLFTHKLIRKWTITFLYIWFTNALVYYGLAFLASDINQNIYLSMLLLMTVEIPGTLMASYLGEKGRRMVLIGIMIIGGLACLACSVVPQGHLRMWLAIVGKMSISGSFSLIFVYAAEIFPTVLRITGLGMCSFCARFGAMIAPYLLRLRVFGDSIPFLVIGTITLVAGLVSFILPETKGKKLPDSLEEVEQLKYSNKNNGQSDYQNIDEQKPIQQSKLKELHSSYSSDEPDVCQDLIKKV